VIARSAALLYIHLAGPTAVAPPPKACEPKHRLL